MGKSTLSNENLSLEIKLVPNDLLITLNQVLEEASNSVFLGLSFLDSEMKNHPEEFLKAEDNFHSFPVFGKTYSIDSRKEILKNWLLKKGFEDLIRAATNVLISAHVVLDLKKELSARNNQASIHELVKIIKDPELSSNPTRRHLPQLLNEVRKSLKDELLYNNEVESINIVRRCLVHRNGVVTKADTKDQDHLILRWLSFIPIYKQEDTNKITEIKEPVMLEGPGKFEVKLKKKVRRFELNEVIKFDFKEFNELVWTVDLFGQDLVSKLEI